MKTSILIMILFAMIACPALSSATTSDNAIFPGEDPDGPSSVPEPRDKILYPGFRSMLVGPYLGLNYNMHDGLFYTTENDLVCCGFNKGDGFAPVVGVKAFFPLSDRWWFSPRLVYEGRGGEFTGDAQPLPILGRDNQVEELLEEYTLNVTMHTVNVDAFAAYDILPDRLYVQAGPSLSVVASKNFRKTVRIVGPPGVTYLDQVTEKEVYNGDMDITESVFFSLRAGVGYFLRISRKLFVNPEVLYSYPLTRVSTDNEWKAGAVQVTVGLTFAF